MAITPYQKKLPSGEIKTLYMVMADSINKYSSLRVQKKRRGITSKPLAERIYRELWISCRDEKPDELSQVTRWHHLRTRYVESIFKNVRCESNLNGFSPHVVRCKKSHLKHSEIWDDRHLDLMTPQFLTEELNKMELGGLSRLMSNHILKEVKCVFGYALNLGVIKNNLFAGMKMRRLPKKRKEALTHEEVKVLLAEAKKLKHPYYHVWLLTLALGLRRSELAGLKWTDLDFKNGLIFLCRQLIPREGLVNLLKDREDRVVSVPDYLIPILKELKLKSTSDFVVEIDCHYWRSGQQAKVIRQFCREIGIKEITHHQLRATHITLALIDGVPLGIVKENVGHARLSTTDEYFRSAGIAMKGQMNGLRLDLPKETPGVVLKLRASN